MPGLPALTPPAGRHPGLNAALHPDRLWIRVARFAVGVLVLAALVRKTCDATVLVAPPGEPWWSLDLYWPQLMHHRVAPLFAALDWLLITRTGRGPWWRPLAWLGYPAAFLVFSWVRGGIDGWYVYDFLDPTLEGGWPAALTTTAEVLAAFLVVAVLLHVAGNARAALAAAGPRQPGVRADPAAQG